ncbi:hypothetical protein V5799_006693 [Amblyomma americanum]|uniref:M13 family peptidase n=1 Tax=Amblyomma americanum TaxID=6943 RepID=A0AAQ4DVN8_AMBAM
MPRQSEHRPRQLTAGDQSKVSRRSEQRSRLPTTSDHGKAATTSGVLSPESPWSRYTQLLSPRREQEPAAPRTNIIIVAVPIVLLGTGLLVLFAFFRGWHQHTSSDCAEPVCKQFAKLIAETVNHSIDPCVNFDAYVCGGWRARRKYSVHSELVSNALDQMTEVVIKNADSLVAGQNLLQKASLFYRSCDVLWRGEADELPVIRECFRRAGIVWPRRSPAPDVLRTLLSLSIDFDWAVIIRVWPVEETLWVFVAPSFHFAADEQGRMRGLDGKRRSFEFLRAQFSEGGGAAAVTFEEARELEESLFRPLDDERLHKRAEALPAASPDVSRLSQSLAKFNVTKVSKFITSNLKYVTKFFDLWKKIGDDKTHVFVSWMAARYASLFANHDLISNYYGTTNQEVIKYQHGRLCYQLLYGYLGDYLFAPYNAEVFQSDLRRDVERIVLSIRTEFADRLASKLPYSNDSTMTVRWSSLDTVMSALTRTIPQDENASSEANSLLPDMNTSLVRNWEAAWKASRLRTANSAPRTLGWYTMYTLSAYSHWDDDFVLAPYVLSFPFYHPTLVDAVKYGALGAHVAKASAEVAIVHYGSANTTTGAVREALKCANKANATDISAALSDQASLQVLVDAFQARGSHSTLEGAEHITAMQLFFLSWCFIRCRGYTERLGDKCNAAVEHVAAFSSTFSCAAGKPLNPEKKCIVF